MRRHGSDYSADQPTSTIRVLGFGVVILLAGCVIAAGPEDVFRPERRVGPAPAGTEEVSLVVEDGVTLDLWYLRRPDAEGTVLFLGGNAFYLADAGPRIETISRHPLDVLMMDYRGYGRSQGQPQVSTMKSDVLAVYDYLVGQRKVDPARLIIHGHSMGSVAAVHVAGNRKTGGLLLESPVSTARAVLRNSIPLLIRPFVRLRLDEDISTVGNLSGIGEIGVPTVFLAGREDEITPHSMARRLHRRSPASYKKLIIVPDGDHNGLYRSDGHHEAYAYLLDQIMPANSAADD
jgi:pimeloyl-ACP methyl ester carboxylesterase